MSLIIFIGLTANRLIGAQDEATSTGTGADPEYTDAPGSTGCSQDTCWASCINTNGVTAPDPDTTWVEGGDWCWLKRGNNAEPPVWDWAKCEDGCSLHVGDVWCDPDNENACGP